MPEPYTVVVWGDSIAASGWPAHAEFSFNVALNTGRPIRIINQGVGGKPASHARNEFDQRIAPHKPDLVIIQFGFNDQRYDGSRGDKPLSTPAEFADHLRDMVTRCRSLGAKVLVLGNHRAPRPQVLPSGLTYDEARIAYSQVARNVATTLAVPFIDMAEAIVFPGVPWHTMTNEDGVHLTETGKHAYACVVSSAIMKIMKS